MDNLIFIGGIHGVGKSYICEKITKKYNIPSYSASQLITNKNKVDYSKDKRVEYIGDNQEILIDALKRININKKHFLLEGHFCLINKDGQITRIPDDTFLKLRPKAIIILVDSIDKISKRLKTRGTDFYNHEFLNSFQKEELKYSEEIAKKLSVPYFNVGPTTSVKFLYQLIIDLLI